MIINGANIVGAKVMSKKNNTQIASITDIIVTPKGDKIQGFVLSGGARGNSVLFKDTKVVTQDEVLVESADVLKDAQKVISKEEKGNYLASERMVTKQGEELGQIQDVFFDTTSGDIEHYSVKPPSAQKEGELVLVKPDDIKTIGKDEVIVKKKAAKNKEEGFFERIKNSLTGGS